MLITSIILENYGSYINHNVIDMECKPNKPIVLIGGLNGNGKTTLLESIMVALYGKISLGIHTTQKDYDGLILARMHRSRGHKAKNMAVSLTFRFNHDGCNDLYTVTRSWVRDEGKISESLSVEKNKQLLQNMDEDQWRQFIGGLIPYGIAKLFFFDGEKITRIAQWDKNGNNLELKKSFDILLGTELVKKLKSDLEVYLMRKIGKVDPTLKKQHDELSSEKDEIRDTIKIMKSELDRKIEDRDKLVRKIKDLEDDILDVGGWYSKNRENMIKTRSILGTKVHAARENIHEILNEHIPIHLLPKSFVNQIEKHLSDDIQLLGGNSAQIIINKNLEKLKNDIKNNKLTYISKSEFSSIFKTFDELSQMCDCKGIPYFDLSPNERNDILYCISNSSNIEDQIQKYSLDYTDQKTKLNSIESDIANIPKDDEIGPKISRLNDAQQEIGALGVEITDIKRNIASKESNLKIIQSRLIKLIKFTHNKEKNDTGVDLATRMQKALDLYHSGLKITKVALLEKNLTDSIKILMRKKMIQRVSIDPETFAIDVYDAYGESMPGGLLSMGESQIIGTALLWALAKTTGRPLPFVIDTPLGRLDGIHRSKLLKSFYPHASHQTVLFSTDSEIGYKEYQTLKNSVSHTYLLAHSESLSTTSIINGYFQENNIAV